MLRQHPGILALDCKDCEAFHYSIPSGKKILHGGGNIPRGTPGRPGYTPPPCFKCPKIRPDFEEARKRLFDQKGRSIIKNPDGLEELSRKNEICYQFHLERGIFGYSAFEEKDGWVRENAVVIRMLEKSLDREELSISLGELLVALYGGK